MRKKFFKYLFFIIFSINIFAQITELKTGAQESEPKFFKLRSHKDIIGICIDTIRAIEQIEPSIKFVGDQNFIPMRRIEKELERGNLDVFFGFIRTKEREDKYIFIDIPIYYVKNILVSRKNDFIIIENLEEIKKLDNNLILMASGVAQARTLKEKGYNIDDNGKTLNANLNKLFTNRGRFIYQSEIEMLSAIKNENAEEKIRIHPIQSEKEGRYIAFSKNTPIDVLEKVTKAMKILRDNGELDRIFKIYVYSE